MAIGADSAVRPAPGAPRRIVGERPRFWLGFAIAAVVLWSLPGAMTPYDLLTLNGVLAPVLLSIGLVLLWGYTGILSFGQMAFYGIGGYAYGIAGINWIEAHGHTDLALLVGLAVPMAFALVVGAAMFYARLQGVYVAIILFVITLVIETFMQQTAGAKWHIGSAFLGGANGLGRSSGELIDPPSLTLGLGESIVTFGGAETSFYYLVLVLVLVLFLGFRALKRSRWGDVLAAVRDDPDRAETFGHDVRLIQLIVFVFSAGLAAMSGILFVSWGTFITPDVFGVTSAILPIIWVAIGGRTSFVGAVAATIALGWLAQQLAVRGNYAFVILGTLLIVVVLLAREGVAPGLAQLARWARARVGGGLGRAKGESHAGP